MIPFGSVLTTLAEVGFTTEPFLTWDATGEVFGHPEQVELDVVVRNGKVVISVPAHGIASHR